MLAPVWQTNMYETETLNRREQGLDIRGEFPMVLDEFGPAYESINTRIDAAIDTLVEGSRRIRARSVTFDYNIEHTSDVVSIVIYAHSRAVTDRTSVKSVNFNPSDGRAMSLTQAVGHNITPLAEARIAEMIRLDPATYHAAFSARPTGQAFYMTNTSLVLLFDEFQLSSVPGATTSISFQRSNLRFYTLQRLDYTISDDGYAIRLIPVGRVLAGLGYTTAWVDGEAVVSRGGRTIITLTPGDNNYQLNGVMQRSLEVAPTMSGNRMYVPISFFDQILPLTAFNVAANGSVTFMTYLGR